NSTVSGNIVSADGSGYYVSVYGGGIDNSGTLTLSNSTISINIANGGGNDYYGSVSGGGIYNSGTLRLSNNTISGNSAVSANAFFGSVSGGGVSNGGTLTAKNNIVANNPSGGNCAGTITSEGHNLSDDASCAASFTQSGDLNSTAAGLDPSGLQANGGPTQTIALLNTSPAVDAVPLSPINYCTDTNGNAVSTDQRGVGRPQGLACDMGAFELGQTQAGQTGQAITFTQLAPATASYNSTFPVAAESTSGLTVTLSLDSGSTSVCSLGAPVVAGVVTSATVTMLSGTGTCTIFALQSGNATYSAAALQQTSAVAQQTGQTIAFGALSNQVLGTAPFTVSATASSGLAVSFASTTPAVCTVSGATVTLVAVGTCTIQATQAGDANYVAATPVNQSFQVMLESQAITFAGAQTTVPVSGVALPNSVTADRAGDVFVVDCEGAQVVEVPAGGGPQTTLRASGLSCPLGMAVDGAGDAFIADTDNSRVVEVPAGGGPQSTVSSSGLVGPFDVAVDGAGDVFIADTDNSRVVEEPAGGGPQITIGSGLRYPSGVAVDGAGDVFIADTYNNRVVEVPAGGGPQTTVGSGLRLPEGVSVDGAGDVFIADSYNFRVVEVQRVAVNFGNVNVCPVGQTTPTPCSQTIPLTYNVGATMSFGTISVVTQGAPNLDFTLSSGSTCTGTVSAGSTCTVNVTFAPLAPGVRMGAVQLTDNLGNLLVTTM